MFITLNIVFPSFPLDSNLLRGTSYSVSYPGLLGQYQEFSERLLLACCVSSTEGTWQPKFRDHRTTPHLPRSHSQKILCLTKFHCIQGRITLTFNTIPICFETSHIGQFDKSIALKTYCFFSLKESLTGFLKSSSPCILHKCLTAYTQQILFANELLPSR